MNLKAVIVEDEVHNRETLKSLLEEFCQGVEVTAMATNVTEAVDVLSTLSPDLVFMDIELQSGTGFDVLRALEAPKFALIFTTAFEQYALQAIKFSSVEYLLKPIDIDELQAAVAKAKEMLEANQYAGQLKVLLENTQRQLSADSKLALATSDGIEFIQVKEVAYCEASGSYTNFFLKGGQKLVVSKNLKEYENILGDFDFMRVHNSFLVNLHEVKKLVKSEGGYILLEGGQQVSISPRKRDEFLLRMGQLG